MGSLWTVNVAAGNGGSGGSADQGNDSRRGNQPLPGEEGFLLLGAIIAIFLVLLVLSLAAPTVARQLRRDRELEALHRGDQYQRAIRLYYLKFKHYPGTMEQLEKSNNIRFLRQKYVDPMTGKADWRLIHLGEQKTTVKGFFGKPLAGIATSGLGSVGDQASSFGTGRPGVGSLPAAGTPGAGGPAAGSGFGGGAGSAGNGALGATSPSGTGGASPFGATGSSPGGSGPGGSGGSSPNGIPSQSASSFTGSGAPFVGVGSSAAGDSIVVLNEQTTYPTWEFIYDPRIEQMKAKSNLLGGGMANGSGLGSGSSGSPTPFGTPPGPATAPSSPPSRTTPQPPPQP